ncbi:hypothetical protein CBM2634_U80020 [Cupriavidus taiwanensis]|uniref:Uncharacterized protein n=1 Tax=Cupriavidus taiwanensis TaxID=164546 RepID=A0A375JD93_9BURK|nr:hypothetical protein CBM2634_U80020 [Cupriavidus taiwanensis]
MATYGGVVCGAGVVDAGALVFSGVLVSGGLACPTASRGPPGPERERTFSFVPDAGGHRKKHCRVHAPDR